MPMPPIPPNAHSDCDICGTTNRYHYYGEWTCTECGQQYLYDEAERIVLTHHQMNLLRKDAGYEPLPETTGSEP